jgi:hypothetical protein
MAGSYTEGVLTFQAYGDLGAHCRVKVRSSTTTDPVEVELAGAGDQHIGVTEYAATNGQMVAVRPRTMPGSKLGEAADTFARGAVLYGAADGKLSDSSGGSAIGIALEAATTAGDLIEWMDFSVLSTTAALVSIADVGGFTATSTAEAALAEIYQSLKSSKASVQVPLGSITLADGTAMTQQATNVTGFAQLDGKEQVIKIPATGTGAVGFSVPVPLDLDGSADINVHVLAGQSGSNNTLSLSCAVYPSAAGDVGNSDIYDDSAKTIVPGVSDLAFTCDAAGVPEAPGTLTVVLGPSGANTTDAIHIYGVWVEYTRALLTA